jgi:hypothetical protein
LVGHSVRDSEHPSDVSCPKLGVEAVGHKDVNRLEPVRRCRWDAVVRPIREGALSETLQLVPDRGGRSPPCDLLVAEAVAGDNGTGIFEWNHPCSDT